MVVEVVFASTKVNMEVGRYNFKLIFRNFNKYFFFKAKRVIYNFYNDLNKFTYVIQQVGLSRSMHLHT